MLLSNACRIRFTGWSVMFWNRLALSALFKSRAVYYLLFSSTCGMEESESFTMMCALLLLRRCLISW